MTVLWGLRDIALLSDMLDVRVREFPMPGSSAFLRSATPPALEATDQMVAFLE